MTDIFKAGDFTSGKMSEIFKKCFIEDLAVINHKQFGKAYMIPEETLAVSVKVILENNESFSKYMKYADPNGDFWINEDEFIFHAISDYYNDHADNWLEVLSLIGRYGISKEKYGNFIQEAKY